MNNTDYGVALATVLSFGFPPALLLMVPLGPACNRSDSQGAQRAYDMPPTAVELARWYETVEELVRAVGKATAPRTRA